MRKVPQLMAKAALGLVIAVVGGLFAYVAVRQSAPGKLSRSHDTVTSTMFIRNCRKCHTKEGLQAGCLSCHTEIGEQLRTQKGYHNFQLAKGLVSTPRKKEFHKQKGCAVCHPEHYGLEYNLLGPKAWEGEMPRKFAHEKIAPFTLEGKHEGLKCEHCHNITHRKPFALPDFPKMERRVSYLGLTQACVQCHKDPHGSQAAARCQDCHVQTAWRPAPKFNHDKFFVIQGGHVNAACQKCHLIAPSAAERSKHIFNLVKGKACADCHQNPHRKQWPRDCDSCHKKTDRAWGDSVRRLTAAEHESSGFRLSAPHNKAACVKCHEAGLPFAMRYRDPQAPGYNRWPKRCEGCHQDAHKGQFTAKHPQCVDCHTAAGFKPAAFTPKEHSSYPLEGAHLKAACVKCHLMDKALDARRFTGVTRKCNECHRDIHWNQFWKDGWTRCDACHGTPASWKKLIFDHETQSRFQLKEAHRKTKCSACHPRVTLANKDVIVQYKPLLMACGDCHTFDER